MSNSGQETEAKFYVLNLTDIERHVQDLGARLIQARVLETNIRFDLPDDRLQSDRRVLRLRQDTDARLTYKSASTNEQGVLSRTEIEFIVEDFEKAKQFLEALDYQPIFSYEKYRTTYALQPSESPIHIMLDELPYGNFVEIEGETVESIRQVSDALNLKWKAAIGASYSALFRHVSKTLNLSFQELSFEKFAGIQVSSDDLGVRVAEDLT